MAAGTGLLASATSTAADVMHTDEDGTVHLPAITLPGSSFLSEETRAALRKARELEKEDAATSNGCPPMEGADRAQMAMIRKCEADAYYKTTSYKRLRDLYAVTLTPQTISGVYTEVFTPNEGVAKRNRERVLINVHGGGFEGGSRTASHMESIPIASVGKFKIVSIDYRQAPEHEFPAASEDVAAVYRELLKTYKPKNIGIYGCSAGGLLTAEVVAWLQKEKLPLPGAVGMFCEGAGYWMEGDSGKAFIAAVGKPEWALSKNPYFKNTDPANPLAFPVRSASVMAKFPPSLLIAGARDFALSSVVHTHSVLISQGVDAQLHVWEGLGHAFFFDPDLPQSREVYSVTVKFFDKHLGT